VGRSRRDRRDSCGGFFTLNLRHASRAGSLQRRLGVLHGITLRQKTVEIPRSALENTLVLQPASFNQELVDVIFLVGNKEKCILEVRSKRTSVFDKRFVSAPHFTATLNNDVVSFRRAYTNGGTVHVGDFYGLPRRTKVRVESATVLGRLGEFLGLHRVAMPHRYGNSKSATGRYLADFTLIAHDGDFYAPNDLKLSDRRGRRTRRHEG